MIRDYLNTKIWLWDWEAIKDLTAKDLEILCLVMGIPKSGSKIEKIRRLKDAAEVRHFTISYPALTIGEIARQSSVRELRSLIKKTKMWQGSMSKYGYVASIINWRDKCNARGKEFLKEVQEDYRSKRPKQLRLL